MMAATAVDRDAVRGPAGLWLALLAGPCVAGLQLSVNYALVKWACATGHRWLLAALAAAFLAVALAGAALGAVHLLAARDDGRAAAQVWSAESRRLLAATAVGLDVLLALFLANTLIAIAVLSPCE